MNKQRATTWVIGLCLLAGGIALAVTVWPNLPAPAGLRWTITVTDQYGQTTILRLDPARPEELEQAATEVIKTLLGSASPPSEGRCTVATWRAVGQAVGGQIPTALGVYPPRYHIMLRADGKYDVVGINVYPDLTSDKEPDPTEQNFIQGISPDYAPSLIANRLVGDVVHEDN